ncbi:MAG: MFS transporter [Elusimicrobiales bacterium]|nr:MFS transporter [Elusimicrobiales bacterium]
MFEDLKKGLTKNVVFLGAVSGLTDISSEMLYPLMPLFLTTVLHAPMSAVGLIEGTAEATASILKAAGGLWSDRTARRKPFVVWGYGLSSLSKPLMALAYAWPLVLFARVTDRIGKGVRTSARDALVASSTPREHWGKAFGFHRAMDTAGAALGPLAALFLMDYMGLDYRPIFIIAFVPAALGVLVLIRFVKESGVDVNAQKTPAAGAENGLSFRESLRRLSPQFRQFLLFYGIFALGNSSDAFLLLKAKNMGFTTAHVILAYVGYNVVYALCAGPAGWLSDKLGRARTLVIGFAIFALVYLGFGLAHDANMVWALFALYGFYGAFNEGVAKAMVSDLSGSGNRGTAMGVFQGATGILAFAASFAAGILWDKIGPAAPFILGAACAAVSSVLLLAMKTPVRAGGA